MWPIRVQRNAITYIWKLQTPNSLTDGHVGKKAFTHQIHCKKHSIQIFSDANLACNIYTDHWHLVKMLSSENALRKTWSWHQVTMSWSWCFWTTKGKNTDGFIWFSREGSSREKFIVWSRSRSCITIAFVHISECRRRMLSFCWQSGGHVWGGSILLSVCSKITIFCFCLSYEYLLPNAGLTGQFCLFAFRKSSSVRKK